MIITLIFLNIILLYKIIQYIEEETKKKVAKIKEEAKKEADLEKVLVVKPEKQKIAKK